MKREKKERGDIGSGCSFVVGIVLFLILLGMAVSLAGCKTVRRDYRELYESETRRTDVLIDSMYRMSQKIDLLSRSITISDSVRHASERTDSLSEKVFVYQKDSTATRVNGDTVYVDRWHWDYRAIDRMRVQMERDSVEHNRAITELQNRVIMLQDSIRQLKEHNSSTSEREKQETSETREKEQPWWKQRIAELGGLIGVAFIIGAIITLARRKKGDGI